MAYIHKTQFSVFFMNWEKLRGPARPTLKNLNFESMDE